MGMPMVSMTDITAVAQAMVTITVHALPQHLTPVVVVTTLRANTAMTSKMIAVTLP